MHLTIRKNGWNAKVTRHASNFSFIVIKRIYIRATLMYTLQDRVYNFFLSCFCIKKWTPPTPYKNKHDMRTLCISFLKSFRRISVCIGWLVHTLKGTWMEKYIWLHFLKSIAHITADKVGRNQKYIYFLLLVNKIE